LFHTVINKPRLEHLDNGLLLWPDFASASNRNHPSLRYRRTSVAKDSSKQPADGQVRQLELLIQAEANLDYQEDEGKTALQKAVLSNSQDCVELLLENRANINAKDKEDRTALYFATEAGHYLLVEYLIRTGIWGSALQAASATGGISTAVSLPESLVTKQCQGSLEAHSTGPTRPGLCPWAWVVQPVETTVGGSSSVRSRNYRRSTTPR
jgi:hypothetical protein